MPNKKRSNYKTQEDKSILSSSTESEESGAETRRQIYYRSPTPTRSATPTASPERRKRKRSTSQHKNRNSDRHPRSPVPYRPPPPSYERHPRSPPPYRPLPVAYERDHHQPYRPAPLTRHQDDSHKRKILPRYEGWSGSNGVIKKRSAKEFSIHSTKKRDKSVLIIGEKQKKRKSTSPVAGPSHRTQNEQLGQVQPTQQPATVATAPQPQVQHLAPVAGPSAQILPLATATVATAPQPQVQHLAPVAGPSAQVLPLAACNYFQQPQCHHSSQQANIVMETLKIVKEIMDSANNIRGRYIGPVPYLQRVKQESTEPAEVITVEEEPRKPAPPEENEATGGASENIESGKATPEETTEQETPERKPAETKGDKSTKKRLERMIQRVKNDEKDRDKKKKENQSRD